MLTYAVKYSKGFKGKIHLGIGGHSEELQLNRADL